MVSVDYAPNPDNYESAVSQLLVKYDSEFVPPLSSRSSTTQTDGLDSEVAASIQPYLEACLNQELIIARDDGEVIGFLSFYVAEEKELLEDYSPCVYVSTTIVEADYREAGVATAMNRLLLDSIVPSRDVRYVTRRTWNTNHASRAYIESLGFELVERVADDRGEGIDSMYYAKDLA